MKKKGLSIILVFLFLLVVLPSFAYSYFLFLNYDTNQNIDTPEDGIDIDSNHIDDLKENIEGGQVTGKEYEIYFFPSTLYTQYYYNYLHDDAGVGLNKETINIQTKGGTVAPEDWFGYKEYNEVTGSFDLVNDEATNKDFDIGYTKFVESYELPKDHNLDKSHALLQVADATFIEYEIHDFYGQYYGSWGIAWGDVGFAIDDESGDYDKAKAVNGRNLDYGNPSINSYTPGYSEFGTDVDEKGRFNWMPPFLDDRFGYWPDSYVSNANKTSAEGINTTDLGRYLPIKISTTDLLNEKDYAKQIIDPATSMGDKQKSTDEYNPGYAEYLDWAKKPKPWRNYSFAGWGYFNPNNSDEYSLLKHEDNYTLSSFTSADIGNTFDILEDLDKYAVYDEETGKYIVRLFPIFSNGKVYGSDATKGGRDSIKLKYNEDPNSEASNANYLSEEYFMYKGSHSSSNLSLAVINNFKFAEDDFNDKYICLQIAGTDKAANWSTGWQPSNINTDVSYLYRPRSPVNYFDKGDGIYNIYVFANNEEFNGIDLSFNESDIMTRMEECYKYYYPSPVKEFSNLTFVDQVINYSPNGTDLNRSFPVQVKIAIEKVYETKLIEGINIEQSEDEQTTSKFDASISMISPDDPVYLKENVLSTGAFTLGPESTEGHKVITDMNIDSFTGYGSENVNQKSFLIRNVDFTNYNSLKEAAFQIRLFKQYQDDLVFNHSANKIYDGDDFRPLNMTNALIYNPGKELLAENIFIDASYYFDFIEVDMAEGTVQYSPHDSETSYELDQRIFIPRHNTYLGMYDFILYYEGGSYTLYCNRHYNVNVKVFASDVSHDNDGYADPSTAELIWERQAFSGSYMNPSDLGENNLSFEETIEKYIRDKGVDGTYYLKDHVSGLTMFTVTLDNGEFNLVQNVSKFRLRKNYYFYLSTEK